MDCSTLGFPLHHDSRSLFKLMSIESVMPSNHLILCCLLLLLSSISLSIRDYSNESVLQIRWPKYWSFSFSVSSSNAYSGLISFRIDWFDLAVQGTLKSLLQHHSPKASVLRCSTLFMVQLSYIWTFVNKVMSLLFNGCLDLSLFFFLGASVFWFHGCSQHPQWYWSPRK